MNEPVFVVNKNTFTHCDRYDGQDYCFPPEEKVQLPRDAATHMFGFGLADKTETLVRIGWASHFDPDLKKIVEDPDGPKKLAKFVFTKSVTVEAPLDSNAA